MKTFQSILLASVLISLTFSGCTTEEPLDHALESDLNGVWTIEHFKSDPYTQVFTSTYYNVHIADDGEEINISHCNPQESHKNMSFVRSEHELISEENNQLHIVNGSIIESVNIPDIVQLTKTSKPDFYNAGRVKINSDIFEPIDENSGVCVQKIIKSTDPEGFHDLLIVLPYRSSYIEVALKYNESVNGNNDSIQKFTISSPVFLQADYYNKFIIPSDLSKVVIENVSITNTSAAFDFEMNTLNYSTPLYTQLGGDNLFGRIQIRF